MEEETSKMISMGIHPYTAREFALAGVRAHHIEGLIIHCRETGEAPEPYIRAMIDAIERLPVDMTSWNTLPDNWQDVR